ncbi:MAG: hypothetical protein M3Y56_07565 [Armatimonadota bacterium]|nr:hypothetical protein [Armatimonadota bacterium]
MIETGTELVNHLFESVAADRMAVLYIGVGEVFSIMVRRRNSGLVRRKRFAEIAIQVMSEIVDEDDFQLHTATDDLVRDSLSLIEQYSINATDALVLCSAVQVANDLRSEGHDLVLIASDVRLLQAGRAEGLSIFNPETDSLPQLQIFVDN